MRTVPDWSIQASWWASGIFATGAVWYFLSVQRYPYASLSAGCAIAFAILAIVLHRKKDAANQRSDGPRTEPTPAEDFVRRYTDQPSHVRFIRALPKFKAVVYESAQAGWDTGITTDMRQASYDVIDFLEHAWLRLAEFYPPKHFGGKNSKTFIRDYIRDRFSYHWAKHEPDGPGTGGTIVGVQTGADVIAELEAMIADAVAALFANQEDFDYQNWLSQWRQGEQAADGDSKIALDRADPLASILALIAKYHSQEIPATPRRISADLAMDPELTLAFMWKYHNEQFFTFRNEGKRPELDTAFFLSPKAWDVIKIVKA